MVNQRKGTTVTFVSISSALIRFLAFVSVSPIVLVRCGTKQRDTRQREFFSTTIAVAAELSTSFAPSDCREGLAGDIAHKSNILMFLDPHRRFC